MSRGGWVFGFSVGEVYVLSKKWGKIPLSEFKKKGGVIKYAENKKGNE
jgi:hypothetical protein